MKIQVNDLKRFKANSASIKHKTTLPILSYLKFSNGTVTKNMLTEFIVHDMPGADEDMLVDEQTLFSLIEITNKKEITITKEGKRIKITDGELVQTSPTDTFSLYPVHQEPEGDLWTMNDLVINAISTASRFIKDEADIPEPIHFVYIGQGYVVGQNGSVGYSEKIKDTTPKIMITKKIATMISKFSDCVFSENQSYMFFDVGICKYGYSKSQLGWSDRTQFAKIEIKELPVFNVNKNDLRRFNELCISSKKGLLSICSLFVNGKLKLESIDSDHEIDIKLDLETASNGIFEDKLHYNPEMMNILLKNVEDELLTFHQHKNTHCFITGQSGFRSLLMGMQ